MRLIDVDALGVGRCSKDVLPAAYCAGWNGLINLIEQAPTIDAVPVVRCRECEKRDKEFVSANGTICCPYMEAFMPADGFCSYGERKEGAENG